MSGMPTLAQLIAFDPDALTTMQDLLSAAGVVTAFNVRDFRAKGDARAVTITIAGGALSTATGSGFTGADTGKVLIVPGAGPSGDRLVTTVTYVSATTLTLNTAASGAVSGILSTLGTDDSAAFVALRNAIIASRVTDYAAGSQFHKCTARGFFPLGDYIVTQPGALMDDTGDSAGNGTMGYKLFGAGEGTRIIYAPTTKGPLFRNLNQFLFPEVKNILFVGASSANAICAYAASSGTAQGWTWEDCVWWGVWYELQQQDALAGVANGNDSWTWIRCRQKGQTGTTAAGAPTGLGVSAVGSGGTFAAGTYYWKLAAYTDLGTTLGSAEVSAAIVLNGSANLTWTAHANTNVAGYKLYRSTVTGGQTKENTLVAIVPGRTTTSYTDTGASAAGHLPAADMSGTGAFFHSGITPGVPNQDQAVVHHAVACNLEPDTGGHIFHLNYGGCIDMDGGSVIIDAVGSSSVGPSRAFYIPDVGTHEAGACKLTVRGTRFEIRSTTGKLIDCGWQFGNIEFDNISTDGYSIPNSQIVATFDNAGNCGPKVTFKESTLSGLHEYVYRNNSYLGGPSVAAYENCSINNSAAADVQSFITHTDADGSFQLGSRWRVEFKRARSGAAYGSQAPQRVMDASSAWLNAMAGEVERRTVSVKTPFGVLPQDPGGTPGTVNIVLPLGAIVTGVHFWMPAKGGGSSATAWSYTLSNSDGTFATCAPGTAWNLGFEHHEQLFKVLLADGQRVITLTGTGVNDNSTSALCLIDYLPGS